MTVETHQVGHQPHLHVVGRDPGPEVVALGGGHGLAATLRAARTYAGGITAVVSMADDGGSTGRLRDAGIALAPGDLRKCLVALAEHGSSLAGAMEYRFTDGELEGHAVGNLLLVAMRQSTADLVSCLEEIGLLLGAEGRVLPATIDSVTLVGITAAGDVVRGQVAVSSSTDLDSVHVEPDDVGLCPEAELAIIGADQIVLGPGSLYTSVLAAAVVPGVAQAIAESDAQFVYVCNLNPQLPETAGYDVAAHLAALERHGLHPDVVLYDPSRMSGAAPDAGPAIVAAQLAKSSGLAHDEALLGAALREVLS